MIYFVSIPFVCSSLCPALYFIVCFYLVVSLFRLPSVPLILCIQIRTSTHLNIIFVDFVRCVRVFDKGHVIFSLSYTHTRTHAQVSIENSLLVSNFMVWHGIVNKLCEWNGT